MAFGNLVIFVKSAPCLSMICYICPALVQLIVIFASVAPLICYFCIFVTFVIPEFCDCEHFCTGISENSATILP